MTEKEVMMMTPDEIATRLRAGEDPLDLSIEAWERRKKIFDRDGEIEKACTSGDHSPMCYSQYEAHGFTGWLSICAGCPFAYDSLGCLCDMMTDFGCAVSMRRWDVVGSLIDDVIAKMREIRQERSGFNEAYELHWFGLGEE